MEIKETSAFTRRLTKLLDEESYRLLQLRLVEDPKAGRLIPEAGGVRKVRWEGSGRGKRGGVRVIYYFAEAQDVLLMLLIYGKNEQDTLTPQQTKALARLTREEFP